VNGISPLPFFVARALVFVFESKAEAEAKANADAGDTPKDGGEDILGLGTLGLLRLFTPATERAFRVLSSRNMRLE